MHLTMRHLAVATALLSCIAHVTCFGGNVAALSMAMQRGMVKTDIGEVSFCEYTPTGKPSGLPLLCGHMNPRSSDEFREAATLLSEKYGRRVVAVDQAGYGCSSNPTKSCDEDDIAASMIAVADSLGITSFAAVGSMLGCLHALVLTNSHPERVGALVLTHPIIPKKMGSPTAPQDPSEVFPLADDGSHVLGIWNKRASWLDNRMNQRCVFDEQRFLMNKVERVEKGIEISDFSKVPYEECASKASCPSLVVIGTQAEEFFAKIGSPGIFEAGPAALPKETSRVVHIEGGSVNVVNTHAEEWAAHVEELLGRAQG